MGLSYGWIDRYDFRLPGQSIDVTDLPDGKYRLWLDVDEQPWFHEKRRDNNVTWADLDLVTKNERKPRRDEDRKRSTDTPQRRRQRRRTIDTRSARILRSCVSAPGEPGIGDTTKGEECGRSFSRRGRDGACDPGRRDRDDMGQHQER